MKNVFFLLISIFVFENILHAQQGRLNVAVSKVTDTKVKIEWTNPYGDSVVQLNVQKSWDSVKNFRTVFVPLSPELPQNGYVDETGGYNMQYYRVFYVLGNGTFFFTKSKKVASGSDFTNEIPEDQKVDSNLIVTVHDDDTIIAQLNYKQYKKFKDSIVSFTRDTLYSLTDADVLLRYYSNNVGWIPSSRVFTNSDGYVQIYLADALQKSYRIRFFDENHKPLFNIQHIDQVQLILDKTDFMRSGWFYFELIEDNKIKERNKFYIPKDF